MTTHDPTGSPSSEPDPSKEIPMVDDVSPAENATGIAATAPDPAEGQDVAVDAEIVTDGAYTLIAADFSDTETALEAYEALKQVEDGATVEIEGVIVVARSDDGQLEVQKVTDHSTRRGLAWGILGGVIVGVLFPPSVLGSALLLGAGGAGIGKLREMHHKSELAEELQDSIAPGHSGIIALVSDPGEIKIREALDKADRIVEKAVDEAVADDLKAAAKNAEGDA